MTREPSFYLPRSAFNGKDFVRTSTSELKPYIHVPSSVSKTLRNILFTEYFPGYSATLDPRFELVK